MEIFIQISFVGYITQEMKWNGTPLNVILKMILKLWISCCCRMVV